MKYDAFVRPLSGDIKQAVEYKDFEFRKMS